MKIITPLVAVALANQALDGPRFEPTPGSEVTRIATWKSRTETDSFSITVGGVGDDTIPSPESLTERTLAIVTKERYVRTVPERPLELVRTFEEITLESTAELSVSTPDGDLEIEAEGEGESALEGLGVRFEWDPDEENYETTWADDYDARPDLLEPLRARAEFLALLPDADQDAELEDTWAVDVDELPALLVPGGALPLEVTTELDVIEGVLDPLLLPGPFDLLRAEFSPEIDGDIEARLASIEDGLATIRFDVEANLNAEILELLSRLVDDAAPPEIGVEAKRASYSMQIDGTGALVWDLEAGRMRSYEFESEVEIDIEFVVAVDADGGVITYEAQETRSGEIGVSIEVSE